MELVEPKKKIPIDVSDVLNTRHPYMDPPFRKSVDPKEISIAFGHRGFEKLFDLLRGDSVDGYEKAQILVMLQPMLHSQEEKMRAIRLGIVRVVAPLLGHDRDVVKSHAARVLAEVAVLRQGKTAIQSSDALQSLNSLVLHDEPELRGNVLLVFLRMADTMEGCMILAESQSVAAIGKALEDSDPEVLSMALQAMTAMTRFDDGTARALEAAVPEILTQLLDISSSFLELELRAMFQISRHPDGKEAFVAANIIPKLGVLLETAQNLSIPVCQLLVGTLNNIMVNKEGKKRASECCLRGLVSLHGTEDKVLKVAVDTGIRSMREHHPARKEIDALLAA